MDRNSTHHPFRMSVALILLTGLFSAGTALAQNGVAFEKIEAHAVNHPLRSLQEAADRASVTPVTPRPPREVPNYREGGRRNPGSGAPGAPDVLAQSVQGQAAAVAGSGFFGASNDDNAATVGYRVAPPDTDGEVGGASGEFFVQMINSITTIFDTANGNRISGPFASNAFWTGMGGFCEPYNQGDPVVLYDETSDRWLVSQFAFPDRGKGSSQCVAISEGPDPRAGFNRYEFSFDNYGFNDYPKHGIVTDSITVMANLFGKRFFNGTFLGVMDKAAMYAGAPTADMVGFNIGANEFGFVAGDLDDAGNVPALFATAMSGNNVFDIWQLDIDWNNPGAASVSQIASIQIAPYSSSLCSSSRGACIPQPNNGPLLESLSDRLMHRLQIRDFGSYQTMVAAHTVDAGGGRAGIRWYEFRNDKDGNGWYRHQQGTFAPNDGLYRWMPSIAMNAAGDIGIGYMVANTGTFVSPAAAGQTAAATGSGALDSAEVICANGAGVQTGTGRSGDYSATSVDPTDGSFWHTNEVFTTSGSFEWNTYVCNFTVGGGGGGNNPPVASFTESCTGLTCSFTDTSTDDGTITAWSWDFGDGGTDSVQDPSHTYGSDGTYTVSLTVTDDGGLQNSTSHTVTVSGGGGSTLTGSSVNNGKTWTAVVTDSDGEALEGTWDTSGTANCDGAGQCSLSGIRKKTGSVVFTATAPASHAGQTVTVIK